MDGEQSMKPVSRVIGCLLLSASWLVGCGGSDDDGGGDTGDTGETGGGDDGGGRLNEVSFSENIAPVLNVKCALCHHPGSPTGLDLTNPEAFVGLSNTWTLSDKELIVDPGNPDNSFI